MGTRGPAPGAKTAPIKFRPGVPVPPPWMDAGGVAEYMRAAEELEAADASVQQMDFAVLCAYSQAYADIGRLSLKIREEGEVTMGAQGPVANPRLRSLALALQTLRTMSQKLGFSPADRARVPKAAASSRADVDSFKDV